MNTMQGESKLTKKEMMRILSGKYEWKKGDIQKTNKNREKGKK